MIKPCDACQTRRMYARTFDMHFWGEDCPYECEDYEHWKRVQETLDCRQDDEKMEETVAKIGRWKEVKGNFFTPGGTPYYECGGCGNTGHLYGAEYPKKKLLCDVCGRINIYPWEQAWEVGSSLWEEDEDD